MERTIVVEIHQTVTTPPRIDNEGSLLSLDTEGSLTKSIEPEAVDPIAKGCFQYLEEVGDTFDASYEYALAHCVARDLQLGAGVAKAFKNRFGIIEEMTTQDKQVGEAAYVQAQTLREARHVFALIPKEKSTGLPEPQDVRRSHQYLKSECVRISLNNPAISMIASGRDSIP